MLDLEGAAKQIVASCPVALGSILSVPNIFLNFLKLLKFIDSSALRRVWIVPKMLNRRSNPSSTC